MEDRYDNLFEEMRNCADLRAYLLSLFNDKKYEDFVSCYEILNSSIGYDDPLRKEFNPIDATPEFHLWLANSLWNIGDYYGAFDASKKISIRCTTESDKITYSLYGTLKTPFSPGNRLNNIINSKEVMESADYMEILRAIVREVVANIDHETIRNHIPLLCKVSSRVAEVDVLTDEDELQHFIDVFTKVFNNAPKNEKWKILGFNLNKIRRICDNPICRKIDPYKSAIRKDELATFMQNISNLTLRPEFIPSNVSYLNRLLKTEEVKYEGCEREMWRKLVVTLINWIKDDVIGMVDSNWKIDVHGKTYYVLTDLLCVAKDNLSEDEFPAYALSLREKVVDAYRRFEILDYLAEYYFIYENWSEALKAYLDLYKDRRASKKKGQIIESRISSLAEKLSPDEIAPFADQVAAVIENRRQQLEKKEKQRADAKADAELRMQMEEAKRKADEERRQVDTQKLADKLIGKLDGLDINIDRNKIVGSVRKFVAMNIKNELLIQLLVDNVIVRLVVPEIIDRPIRINEWGRPMKNKRDGNYLYDMSWTSLAQFYADDAEGLGKIAPSFKYDLLRRIIASRESRDCKNAEQWAKIYSLMTDEYLARNNASEATNTLNSAKKMYVEFKKRSKANSYPLDRELERQASAISELKKLGNTPAEVLKSKYADKIDKKCDSSRFPVYVGYAMRDFIAKTSLPKGGFTTNDITQTDEEIQELKRLINKDKESCTPAMARGLGKLYFKRAILSLLLEDGYRQEENLRDSLRQAFFRMRVKLTGLPSSFRLFWAICEVGVGQNIIPETTQIFLYREVFGGDEQGDMRKDVGSHIVRKLADSSATDKDKFITYLVDASINSRVMEESVSKFLPDISTLIEHRKNLFDSIRTPKGAYGSLDDLVYRLEEVADLISGEITSARKDAANIVAVRGIIRDYRNYINSGNVSPSDLIILENKTNALIEEIISWPSVLSVEGLLPVLDMLRMKTQEERSQTDIASDEGVDACVVDVTPVVDGLFNAYIKVRRLGNSPLHNLYVVVKKELDDNKHLDSICYDTGDELAGGDSKLYAFTFRVDAIQSLPQQLTFSFKTNYRLIGKLRKSQLFRLKLPIEHSDGLIKLHNPYFGLSESEDFVINHAEMFKGREEILDKFKRLYLQAGKHIGFVYGQRRCGKTAFANKLRALLNESDPDILIAGHSFGKIESRNSVADAIFGVLRNEMRTRIRKSRVAEEIKALTDPAERRRRQTELTNSIPQIVFTDETPTTSLIDAIRDLRDYCEACGMEFPKRIFLVLDEFTNVLTAADNDENLRVIFDDWKQMFDIDGVKIHLLLIGHNNAPAILHESWARESIGRFLNHKEEFVRLSVFEDAIKDESRMLITEPLVAQNVIIDDAAVKMLKHMSGRSPYFLMSLMEVAVDYMNSIGSHHLYGVDVIKVRNIWLKKFNGSKFNPLMDCSEKIGDLGAAERRDLCKKVLETVACLATEASRDPDNQLISRRNVSVEGYSDDDVHAMIDDLIMRGVITCIGDVDIKINVDIFRYWLEKQYKLNHPKN